MKNLLVSDYDSTFYLNDKDIENNINLLNKRANDLLFVIATGRSYKDYILKKNKYNINSDYVIINHGAGILKNNKIIYRVLIDNEIKNELIKDLELEKTTINFACSDKESRLLITNDNLTKICLKYENVGMALKKYKEIENKYFKDLKCYLNSNKTVIEIVSSKADKKNAIIKIMELENINKKNVFTVGDGDTDYEMLKYFNGFQMYNATKKLKSLNLKKVNSVSEIIMKLIDFK